MNVRMMAEMHRGRASFMATEGSRCGDKGLTRKRQSHDKICQPYHLLTLNSGRKKINRSACYLRLKAGARSASVKPFLYRREFDMPPLGTDTPSNAPALFIH
jgi:hypothetical protein